MGRYASAALLAVQGAIVTAVGSSMRLYDRVPENPTFPYASFGPMEGLDDSDGCRDGAEVFIQIDVWSRAVGRVEALTLAAQLADLLDTDLTVPGHEVITHEMDGLNCQSGRDGLTTQAILRLRYALEPTS
ncbi:MAG: DUF3168 domain-containing protein [Caulobacter sp.]|nr:DUF3168 domain-containing protein [Caulobacter sp.]